MTDTLEGPDAAEKVRFLPENFDLMVRDTAYFLWEQEGRPEGRADEFWYRALEDHFRARAYAIWLAEGRPDGRALDHWDLARNSPAQGGPA